MKSFLKTYWIPMILISMGLSSTAYLAWKDIKLNNDLVELSLSGNQVAIEILVKYKNPSELNERIVYEALKGNEHALKVLEIVP